MCDCQDRPCCGCFSNAELRGDYQDEDERWYPEDHDDEDYGQSYEMINKENAALDNDCQTDEDVDPDMPPW